MDGRVVLVTAAGSGMGAEIARKVASLGAKVAILSASGKGAALAEELGGLGHTGSNLVADDLAAVVAAAIERYGRSAVQTPLLHLGDDGFTDIS